MEAHPVGILKKMVKQIAFSGILNDAPESNPDFYNWNKVKVPYYDGSSFTGDVELVDPMSNRAILQRRKNMLSCYNARPTSQTNEQS